MGAARRKESINRAAKFNIIALYDDIALLPATSRARSRNPTVSSSAHKWYRNVFRYIWLLRYICRMLLTAFFFPCPLYFY